MKGYKANIVNNERRGRLVIVPPICKHSPTSVSNAREASLKVRGAHLFNCIPRDLRDTNSGTIENFKFMLDDWLTTIPDQPSIPSRQRAAATNSLLDKVPLVMRKCTSYY